MLSKLWVQDGGRENKIDFKERKVKNIFQSCSFFSFEQNRLWFASSRNIIKQAELACVLIMQSESAWEVGGDAAALAWFVGSQLV